MAEYVWPPQGTQAGTVIGPGSSTDNAVVRWNGTTGESVQNSGIIVDDSDNVTGVESITIDGLTASRAVVTDSNKKLASSATTATELGYVSGVTSAIQTQLDAKIPLTQKGAANGVATLDASTKIPQAQLPAIAITDTFVVNSQAAMLALSAETGDIAVRTDLNKTFILAGSDPTILANWQELLTPTDTVLSVNGQTGAVVLSTTDISEGSNLYYTDERAQDAVGGMLVDTDDIDLAYSDATPSITATLKSAAITAKTEVTADVADYVLISDTSDGGNLKKADLGDFLLTTATQTATNKTLDNPVIDNSLTMLHESTPSAPSSGRVRVYPKSDNNLYVLDSSGVETAIGSGGGSGTGSLNIVDNPSAVSNTTGWTAATNYTVSRDTSNSPLAGVIDSCFAISTTTASSETSTSGVYAASLACPAALRSMPLQLQMYVTVPASSAGVWRVSVYNSSGTRVSLRSDSSGATTLLAGFTGPFTTSFDADTGATYTVAFTQTTRSSSNTLYVTNISIGNGITAQGAAVSNEQSYSSPVTQGFGTISSDSLKYYRIGSYLRMTGRFTTGTVTASAAQITLPLGLTIGDTGSGAPRQVYGSWWHNITTASSPKRGVLGAVTGDTYVSFSLDDYTSGTSPFGSLAGNQVTGNSTVLGVDFTVPISQWAGNGTVNLGQGAQVEYAYNSDVSSTATVTASGFAYGPSGVAFSASWAVGTQYTRRVRFQYPIQDDDLVVLECWNNGVWNALENVLYGVTRQTATTYGARIAPVSGSSTDVDINFTEGGYASTVGYASNGAAWSVLNANYKWRVRKAKASAPVGFGLAGTDGSSGLYKAGQAPGLTTGVAIGAGYLGQEIIASRARSSASGLTTITQASIVQLDLTPGSWLVSATVGFTGTATATTQIRWGISTSSVATPGATEWDAGLGGSTSASNNLNNIDFVSSTRPVRIDVSANTSYYLNVYAAFSGGTCSAYGQLSAIRKA